MHQANPARMAGVLPQAPRRLQLARVIGWSKTLSSYATGAEARELSAGQPARRWRRIANHPSSGRKWPGSTERHPTVSNQCLGSIRWCRYPWCRSVDFTAARCDELNAAHVTTSAASCHSKDPAADRAPGNRADGRHRGGVLRVVSSGRGAGKYSRVQSNESPTLNGPDHDTAAGPPRNRRSHSFSSSQCPVPNWSSATTTLVRSSPPLFVIVNVITSSLVGPTTCLLAASKITTPFAVVLPMVDQFLDVGTGTGGGVVPFHASLSSTGLLEYIAALTAAASLRTSTQRRQQCRWNEAPTLNGPSHFRPVVDYPAMKSQADALQRARTAGGRIGHDNIDEPLSTVIRDQRSAHPFVASHGLHHNVIVITSGRTISDVDHFTISRDQTITSNSASATRTGRHEHQLFDQRHHCRRRSRARL